MYSLISDIVAADGKNYVPLPNGRLDDILDGEKSIIIQEVSDEHATNCLMAVPKSKAHYLDEAKARGDLFLMSDRHAGRIIPYTGPEKSLFPKGTEFLLEFPKMLYSTFPYGYNVRSCLLSGEVKVINNFPEKTIEIWDSGIYKAFERIVNGPAYDNVRIPL